MQNARLGRLGDYSRTSTDTHLCVVCSHEVMGPAITGSANVLINHRPALRVGDRGVHAGCCGPNTWHAKHGAVSVLINNRPAHRINDDVEHCGGDGTLIQGSANVLVGDFSKPAGDNDDDFLLAWIGWDVLP